MSSMRAQLMPLDGGQPVDLAKEMILIGRQEDCDLRLDHKSVSKQHCVIVKTDGLLLLRDLGSTNGTRVNGQRIRRAALLPNDQLNIASLRFKVSFSADEEPAVEPNEYTQQMDARDVAKLLGKNAKTADEDEEDSIQDMNMPPLQANALPDAYDEKPAKKK